MPKAIWLKYNDKENCYFLFTQPRPKADIRKRHVVKINMIKEFYKAIDEDSEMSLIRAQELLDSDQLLTGLGKYYSKCTIPESVNLSLIHI